MRSAARLLALAVVVLVAQPPPARAQAPQKPVGGPGPVEEGPDLRIVRRQKPLFGAVAEILAAVQDEEQARGAAAHMEAAFAEMARIESLFDEDAPGSAVARINAAAGADPVVIDPETFAVLSEAQRIAKLSRGAFDATAAVYADVWRFDEEEAPAPTADGEAAPDAGPVEASRAVPKKAALDALRPLVGYADLVLDGAARSAQLKRAGARISLAPVAKAYALDRAASVLESRGLKSFLVTAGGDLVVRGKKGGKPWTIGIQDPRAPGYFAALTASPGAVMTSGDYERFFFEEGVRYHDVLDPRTGMPAPRVRSVTVAGADALAAEAVARAVFALGPKEGLALVERLKSVEAVVVTSDNRVVLSKGLRGALQYRPPTDGP